MEYRIKSFQYIDEYGNGHEKSYFIEYQKTFLVYWKRWVRVKHLDCGMGDCSRVTTYFKRPEHAEAFAKEHLCGGRVYDGYETKIIKQSSCS